MRKDTTRHRFDGIKEATTDHTLDAGLEVRLLCGGGKDICLGENTSVSAGSSTLIHEETAIHGNQDNLWCNAIRKLIVALNSQLEVKITQRTSRIIVLCQLNILTKLQHQERTRTSDTATAT